MIYSKKIKYTLLIALFIITGCSQPRYDYSIHKPKVRFKPSTSALNKLNRQTYGRPYVWAAENNSCYDCSGLTYYRRHYIGARRYYNFNNYQQFQPTMQTAYAQTTPIRKSTSTNLLTLSQPLQNSDTYYIKAGLFKNYPSALITKLELSGMQVTTKEDNGYYKVLVGPFSNYTQAQENKNYNASLLSNSQIIKGNG